MSESPSLPEEIAQRHVGLGNLLELLPDWPAPFPGYYLYYPSRRQQSAAFSLLIEALRYRGSECQLSTHCGH